MANRTDNFGLLALKPGDGLAEGGYAFLNDNIWKIDRLLAATVSHDHTNTGVALPDPLVAPTLALDTISGNLPAGTTIRYRYTYVDQYGTETAGGPEAVVSTAAVVQKPLAPGVLASTAGGVLLGGLYNYALTAYVGTDTEETSIGGRNNTSVPFTTATNSITLTMPALPAGATGFNIYRRGPGEAYYAYLDSITGSNLDLPGASGDYAHAPDSVAASIIGDIDIRAHSTADDWTPASSQTLASKWAATGNQRSYNLFIDASGNLNLAWSVDGTAITTVTSTMPVSALDGSDMHIRATLDVDNGAVGNDVTFYTSSNGSAWTQLGTIVTTAGVTSVFDSTALLEIASTDGGTGSVFAGKMHSVQIYNGIGGTLAVDFNPSVDANLGDLAFTSSTGEIWTLGGAATIVAGVYVDQNTVTPNVSRQPPSTNLTNSTNNVTVTLPGAVPVNSTWKVYRTFVSGNWDTSDLKHVVEETFVGSGIITPEFLDLGNGTGLGTIPETTEIAAVPSQISNNEVDFSWATTWAAVVSGWSLGNGTVVSRFSQLGKIVFAKITITAGTTTTYAGALTLDLPATALSAQHLGISGVAVDSSTGNVAPILCQLDTTASLKFLPLTTVIQAGAGLSGATPWTWASGDSVEALIVYEAA